MKPKDIFGLAVRLLGLLFLYLGLKAATQLLDLDLIEDPDKNEIINDLLPVIFNLAAAWWLLGGGLVRRAYPDASKTSGPLSAQSKPPTSSPLPAAAPELTRMERAEEKLAALVEKPKERQAA